MPPAPLHVVTGALGYTGRAVTERLLARGLRVRTLTNSPNRPNPFGERLDIHPLNFHDADALARSLDGAAVLYNTYWVRYNHRLFNFDTAVANTKSLFDAARRAGVARIVHVSILHADKADDLAYYRGKHELEDALRALGTPHAIVRPGVLFGLGDILVNNIAWAVRHLPVVGVFGKGDYRLRPLHVGDMADLMIDQAHRDDSTTTDAVGPESFAYIDLVRALARILRVRRAIVPVPPWLGLAVAYALSPVVRDVIITREEITGLMRGLLDSDAPAAGPTALTAWAEQHRETLGRRYASEVGRRVKRTLAYEHV
ncbi:MAG TPA: NAD(P)H-binding protein [Phycisphaerales bacterium]|nr:NAD(P)H-binding protein [Phycisphaerales bacterium]